MNLHAFFSADASRNLQTNKNKKEQHEKEIRRKKQRKRDDKSRRTIKKNGRERERDRESRHERKRKKQTETVRSPRPTYTCNGFSHWHASILNCFLIEIPPSPLRAHTLRREIIRPQAD